MAEPTPKLSTLLWRGWRTKCPQCGQGKMYQRWMRLHERCPVCGLTFLQNQGDLFGPLVLLDRVLFLIPLIVVFYFGVFHPSPVGLVAFGGITFFLLIYTMPNRNGVSLAIDYFIRRKEDSAA